LNVHVPSSGAIAGDEKFRKPGSKSSCEEEVAVMRGMDHQQSGMFSYAARVRAAYGPNYDRLVALKNKHDPTNFFRMYQNIEPSS